MKKILVYIFPFLIVAFFAMMVTSCADHDFDWEEAYQNNPEYKYQQVFRSVFGDVSPDQSWDFSGFSGEIDPLTRATTDDKTCIGSKRYMVEDLSTDTSTSIDGYKSDIDFNDIVVDFYQYSDGSQKAIIRAMGGTLDFELLVGGTKVFQKSTDGFDAKTMYNTGFGTDKRGDGRFYSETILKEINIDDFQCKWIPSDNNIKFVLNPGLKEMQSNNSYFNDSYNVYEISFPDPGYLAPRIIAFPTNTAWMHERVAINFISSPSNPGSGSSPTYSLTLMASAGGNATISGTNSSSGNYAFGTSTTIIASPNSGFKFLQWSDGSTDASRTITVESDIELTATFVAKTMYTVSLSVNDNAMGSVSGGGSYEEGSTVTINATPNSGYEFVSWSDGNTDASRTFNNISEGISLTATFRKTETGLPIDGKDINSKFDWMTLPNNNIIGSVPALGCKINQLPNGSSNQGIVVVNLVYEVRNGYQTVQTPTFYYLNKKQDNYYEGTQIIAYPNQYPGPDDINKDNGPCHISFQVSVDLADCSDGEILFLRINNPYDCTLISKDARIIPNQH